MELVGAFFLFIGGSLVGLLLGRFTSTSITSGEKIPKVQLSALLGEIYDQYTQTISRHRLLITISSKLNESIELYQWYVLLKPEGSSRDKKIIYRPQNLASTLPAGEQFMIEVTDLSLFDGAELMAIVVRSNHGEFRLEGRELQKLNLELSQVEID